MNCVQPWRIENSFCTIHKLVNITHFIIILHKVLHCLQLLAYTNYCKPYTDVIGTWFVKISRITIECLLIFKCISMITPFSLLFYCAVHILVAQLILVRILCEYVLDWLGDTLYTVQVKALSPWKKKEKGRRRERPVRVIKSYGYSVPLVTSYT